MSFTVIILLVVSGVAVGFINTLSAGGTAISIALYLALGLDANTANATNRIGVLIQSSLSTGMFAQKGYLNNTKVFLLAVPTVIGAAAGAILSLLLPTPVFSYFLGVSLLIMLVFLFASPSSFDKDDEKKTEKGIGFLHHIVFFLIGIYGGFIQVGTGFFLMAAGSMLLGYNIVKTNAVKTCIMALYTMVAIIVFVSGENIHWQYGLLHSAGTLVGSFLAARFAFKKGAKLVRWFVIIVIVFTTLYLFKILDLNLFFQTLIHKN